MKLRIFLFCKGGGLLRVMYLWSGDFFCFVRGVKVLVKWKDFFLFFGSGGCFGKGFCEWRDSFCFGKAELLWQRFLWSGESFFFRR